jgi:hypothetical protein
MIIKWWQGTDAYTLYKYPPSSRLLWYVAIFFRRIFWRLFHKHFVHWINHPELGNVLEKVGIFDYVVVENPNYDHTVYDKIPHKSFNILYYHPNKRNPKWINWIYGINTIFSIIAKLKENKEITWIRLDGTAKMKDILPVTDCYIKVMTHISSGKNRIAKECEINNIPVIYTDYTKTSEENVNYVLRRIDEYRKNASVT